MSNLQSIRKRLGVSQTELANGIGVSQGAVSHCECGRQEIMPDVARRLIQFAAERGVQIGFDDIYSTGEQDKAASESPVECASGDPRHGIERRRPEPRQSDRRKED